MNMTLFFRAFMLIIFGLMENGQRGPSYKPGKGKGF